MGSGGVAKSFKFILKLTFINFLLTNEKEKSIWQWIPRAVVLRV